METPEQVAIALNRAAREGGVRCHELGIKPARGHQLLNRMAHDGRLHRLRISHKNVRYFLNEAGAQAYCKAERVAPAPVIVKHAHGHAWWKPNDPTVPTIIPPHVKTQVCPSPNLGLHTSWGCGINPLVA